MLQKTEVIKNRHYLIIIGVWSGILGKTIFANRYGTQSPTDKKVMWDELTQIKLAHSGIWLLFGDFNVVRQRAERFNSQFCPASATTFNYFIHESGLHDFNMGGERFTYMSMVDAKLSKLDRFLAC